MPAQSNILKHSSCLFNLQCSRQKYPHDKGEFIIAIYKAAVFINYLTLRNTSRSFLKNAPDDLVKCNIAIKCNQNSCYLRRVIAAQFTVRHEYFVVNNMSIKAELIVFPFLIQATFHFNSIQSYILNFYFHFN